MRCDGQTPKPAAEGRAMMTNTPGSSAASQHLCSSRHRQYFSLFWSHIPNIAILSIYGTSNVNCLERLACTFKALSWSTTSCSTRSLSTILRHAASRQPGCRKHERLQSQMFGPLDLNTLRITSESGGLGRLSALAHTFRHQHARIRALHPLGRTVAQHPSADGSWPKLGDI